MYQDPGVLLSLECCCFLQYLPSKMLKERVRMTMMMTTTTEVQFGVLHPFSLEA